jgi:hypothetical protein
MKDLNVLHEVQSTIEIKDKRTKEKNVHSHAHLIFWNNLVNDYDLNPVPQVQLNISKILKNIKPIEKG